MPRAKKVKTLNDPEPEKETQNDLRCSEEVMESREEMGSDGHEEGPAQGKKSEQSKTRKRILSYPFSDEQEKELAEWFSDNQCLYNRRLKAFKNRDLKHRLMEEKAKEFDPQCTVEQLNNFLKSMRTQYSRLTHPKSGKGASMSDRDRWILNTFNFLEGHIVRIRGRTVGMAQTTEDHSDDDTEDNDIDMYDDDVEDEEIVEVLTPLTQEAGPSGTKQTTTRKGKGRMKTKSNASADDEMDKEMIKKLIQRADEIKEIRQSTLSLKTPTAMLTPQEEQVKSFVAYLTTQLMQIRQERWFNFTVESMKLVQSYLMQGSPERSATSSYLAPPASSNNPSPTQLPTPHPPRQPHYYKMPAPSFPHDPQMLPPPPPPPPPPPRMVTQSGSCPGFYPQTPTPQSSYSQQRYSASTGFQRLTTSGIMAQKNHIPEPELSPMSMLFSSGMPSTTVESHGNLAGNVMEGSLQEAVSTADDPS